MEIAVHARTHAALAQPFRKGLKARWRRHRPSLSQLRAPLARLGVYYHNDLVFTRISVYTYVEERFEVRARERVRRRAEDDGADFFSRRKSRLGNERRRAAAEKCISRTLNFLWALRGCWVKVRGSRLGAILLRECITEVTCKVIDFVIGSVKGGIKI